MVWVHRNSWSSENRITRDHAITNEKTCLKSAIEADYQASLLLHAIGFKYVSVDQKKYSTEDDPVDGCTRIEST